MREEKNQRTQDNDEDDKSDSSDTNLSKIPRLNPDLCVDSAQKFSKLQINKKYRDDYIKFLHQQWTQPENLEDFLDKSTGFEKYEIPYKIGLFPDFLENKFDNQDVNNCLELANEMISKVKWLTKRIDLYEFQQSAPLESLNKDEYPYAHEFLQLLWLSVKPWLEAITDMIFHRISASCSMYNCGDHLLIHDDLRGDRRIAFIFYISPWPEREQWQIEHGGCLDIINRNKDGNPYLPPYKQIAPKNNQFIFFEVSSKSYHRVDEVKSFDYPRLSINGWFYGVANKHLAQEKALIVLPSLQEIYQAPLKIIECESSSNMLSNWLNKNYLLDDTKKMIQKRIEMTSEICLCNFLQPKNYANILKQLSTDKKLKWTRVGPANIRNYEMLDLSTATDILKDFIDLLCSEQVFQLYHEYTELDLAGDQAKKPTCYLEVQKWTNGDYTILYDHAIKNSDTLDVVYYLNTAEGAGVVNYVRIDDTVSSKVVEVSSDCDCDSDDAVDNNTNGEESLGNKNELDNCDECVAESTEDDAGKDEDEKYDDDDSSNEKMTTENFPNISTDVGVLSNSVDDSVLLTVNPVSNSLCMVYYCEGTSKFVKYISQKTPMPNGPVFVISCSYKE